MGEREYLVAKSLPRRLKDTLREASGSGVFPPETPLYSYNRMNAHYFGRAGASRSMDIDDARSMGESAADANRQMMASRKPKPRIADVHIANAEALKARRVDRSMVLEGRKVVRSAEKILRRRLP